jgi:D-alanyl-D-alanine endopeptidase (penicillin-binding protein 7)
VTFFISVDSDGIFNVNAFQNNAMRLNSTVISSVSNLWSRRFITMMTAGLVGAFLLAPDFAEAKQRKEVTHKTLKSSKKKTSAAVKLAKRTTQFAAVAAVPLRVSFGQKAGLHASSDPLDLRSSVALVIDQDTREVLLSKNDQAVLPIASLTKLMTGLVISEAQLPMSEMVMITQADVDTEKGSSSRLAVGTVLRRGDLLHLALMSSENRAAHALGRTFPGGLDAFVARMNGRAKSLGMKDTRYVEPTGLSSNNQSSAHDLATLVGAAYKEPVLRELSTSHGREIAVGHRTLQYNNTNRLVKSPQWDIGIQKTGFINEAGQCLVMQAQVSGRKLIMVFLDSAGKLSRIADAERVRRWVEKSSALSIGSKHVALSDQMPS